MTALDDTDFTAVQDYLVTTAGLVFDQSRRAALSAAVHDRLRASGAPDVATYLELVHTGAGGAERQRLLDSVTVKETHFFRNAPQVEALRTRILPELLHRSARSGRTLTIWSAGCATGEEPYTLAMLLLEHSTVLRTQAMQPRILGTDVSADALRVASRAVYSGRTLAALPVSARDRWMEVRPGRAYAVTDRVRSLVDLRHHNLVTDPPPFGPGEVDLVVCRNVTIYFGRETTGRLVAAFHRVLSTDGWLVLGHSETLWQRSDDFTLVPVGDAFAYRRGRAPRPAAGRSGPRTSVRRLPAVRTPRASSVGAPAAPAAARTASTVLTDARQLLADGHYEDAARMAAEAATLDPLLSDAYVVLGQARSTLGDDSAAVAPLRKAVYLDPSAGHAHFLLAGALARLAQHGPAAVSYRAAAAALPAMSAARRLELLGGRDVAELVALCDRLAEESARLAAVPVESGAHR